MKAPKNQNNKGKVKAPKMQKYAVGGGISGYNTNGQAIDRFGRAIPNQNYGVDENSSSWNQGANPQATGNDDGNQGMGNQGAPGIDGKQRKKIDPKTLESASNAAMVLGNMAYQKPTDIYQSEADANKEAAINATVDQVGNSASPYYGLIKGGQGMVKGALAKDKYGEFKPGVNAAIGEVMTSPLENISHEAAKGNIGGVLREANGLTVGTRAGMKLIGKDKETKGFFGTVNKASGQTARNEEKNKAFTQQLKEVKAANNADLRQQGMANRDAGLSPDVQLTNKYDISNPTYNKDKRLILGDGSVYMGPQTLNKGGEVKGGTIVGKGGPKSDSIFTNSKDGIKPGSFIVPAEKNHLAKQLRKEVLGDDPNRIAEFKKTSESEGDIAVSRDEQLLTPEEKEMIVAEKGPGILKMLAPNAKENKGKYKDGTDPSGITAESLQETPGAKKKAVKAPLNPLDTIVFNNQAKQYDTGEKDITFHTVGNKRVLVSDVKNIMEDKARFVPMNPVEYKQLVKYRNEASKKTDPVVPKVLPPFVYKNGNGTYQEQSDAYNKAYLTPAPVVTPPVTPIVTPTVTPKVGYAQGGLLGNLTDRENMREYKDGGLTAKKAKMMLHDGTINGKPITEAQRKYFGWVAGGSKEAKAEGGDIFGGNKDGGKIMAPKMMYAKGGKVGKRKNSTGNAYYDKELDNVSSKEYNSVSDIESEINKLNELSNKYKSQYGTYSSEIGDRIRELNGIKPNVEKQQAEDKRTSDINETINSTKKELKSLGATDNQIKQYEESFKGKSNQLREYALDDARKKVLKEIVSKKAIDSGAKDRNLMTEASNFYRKKGVDALTNIEMAKRNPEKYTKEQIDSFKNDYNLYVQKQKDVADASQKGGMMLVRERDLYNEKKGNPSTNNAPTESKVSAPKASKVNDSTAYSDKGFGDVLPKSDSTVTPPVTTAPTTDPAITDGTTTRGTAQGSGVKDTSGASAKSPKAVSVPKSLKFVPKMAQEGEGDNVVVPGDNLSPNERAAVTSQQKIETDNAKKLSDSAMAAGTSTPDSNNPPAKNTELNDALRRFNPESLIGAGQSILGYNMLKKEERPTYKFQLDPTYQASVDRAQRDATYGFTAEQKALANQEINNATNDARFQARNTGSNGSTAFNQEMQAINQGWMNQLGLTSKDQELRMQKQLYADQVAKERADITTGAKRQAYLDAKGKFDEKQAVGSELVGAGIRNVIGSFRLNKELEAAKAAKEQQDAYLKTIGTA